MHSVTEQIILENVGKKKTKHRLAQSVKWVQTSIYKASEWL